ncbi:hypothetical protein N3K66_004100 [Trichothecium roseum]|uniref:Uncharacterized protein n=1 Tax=Trichothecium roseum TaxID=47278 RepID=A0ACC0V297_9HYPO|nr:hypothetical protein N3K66_004100 [Trichothecium roseum]
MGNIFGGPKAPPQPVYREPDPYPTYDIPLYREVRARPRCRQYDRGTCNYGANCRFAHDGPVIPRVRKPCRFFAKGSCPYGRGCKFSHEAPSMEDDGDGEADNDDRTWEREIGGAWVRFDPGGATNKVSLPSDYSAIRINGLTPKTSIDYVMRILDTVGLSVVRSQVRLTHHKAKETCAAIIQAEDPTFSKDACNRLATCLHLGHLEITSIPVPGPKESTFSQIQRNQVSCSWYRPTRKASLHYDTRKQAANVHRKYRAGTYKLRDVKVRATLRQSNKSIQKGRAKSWLVVLDELPENSTEQDVIHDILNNERPREVDISQPNYQADFDVDATFIQSMLDQSGPIQRWDPMNSAQGKRFKVKVTFAEEADAQAATASLNNSSLPFHSDGKLFVQHLVSARFKVSTRVYNVVSQSVNQLKAKFFRQGVFLSISADLQFYHVINIEGENQQMVAQAQKEVQDAVSGRVINLEDEALLLAGFKMNAENRRKLKSIEDKFSIVVTRDPRLLQVRLYGKQKSFYGATEDVRKVLRETVSSAQEGVTAGRRRSSVAGKEGAEADCSICACEAEHPVQLACGHVYCAGCFEDMCAAEGGRPREYRITCEGAGGDCKQVISLEEMQTLLLCETFEGALSASFVSYVRRHPKQFRFCPTPDCDQIYRVSSTELGQPPTSTCMKCLSSTCTACHTSHVGSGCAGDKGHASSILDAKTKEQLGIKDCPECDSPIHKYDGCNHVTCATCNIHICWVCRKTFKESSLCYTHMRALHGTIYG